MIRVLYHVNKIFASVSYILLNDEKRICWVVDIGDCDEICKLMHGYELRGIFLTHVHYDHIYGLNELQNKYSKVPIYTNEFGLKSLTNPEDNLSAYHDDCFVLRNIDNVIVVREGNMIDIGSKHVIVMETPGHDYSCLSYLVDKFCFTGDTYIPGVKIFTKLQNGDSEMAQRSKERLEQIDGVVIYPGHYIDILSDKITSNQY